MKNSNSKELKSCQFTNFTLHRTKFCL